MPDTLKVERLKIAGVTDFPHGRYGNKFPGVKAYLQSKPRIRQYIDLSSCLNFRYATNPNVLKGVGKLITVRRGTPLAVEWDWIHLYRNRQQYNTSTPHLLHADMLKMDKLLVKYLVDINLIPTQCEIIIVILKYFFWGSKSLDKIILTDLFVLVFAALDWSILQKIIETYIPGSLALRYQNSLFLTNTDFNSITDMMYTVWLYSNIFLTLSCLKADYKVDHDHFNFGLMLQRVRPMANDFVAIKHYLKYGPIKYNEEPAKSSLLELMSNDPCTRGEFRTIINHNGVCDDEKNSVASDFSGVWNIRDHGEHKWCPRNYVRNPDNTYNDEHFELLTQNDNSTKYVNEFDGIFKTLVFSGIQNDTKARVISTITKKLRNGSVPCILDYSPLKIFDETKYLNCVQATAMNVLLISMMDPQMVFICLLLAHVLLWQRKFSANREIIVTLGSVSKQHYARVQLWLHNVGVKGFDSPLLVLKHAALHDYIKSLHYAEHRKPWLSSSSVQAPKYSPDWNISLLSVFRNWDVIYADNCCGLPFKLYKFMKWSYDKNSPWNKINCSLYNKNYLLDQFAPIFGNQDKKAEFDENWSKWNMNGKQAMPHLKHVQNVEAYKHKDSKIIHPQRQMGNQYQHSQTVSRPVIAGLLPEHRSVWAPMVQLEKRGNLRDAASKILSPLSPSPEHQGCQPHSHHSHNQIVVNVSNLPNTPPPPRISESDFEYSFSPPDGAAISVSSYSDMNADSARDTGSKVSALTESNIAAFAHYNKFELEAQQMQQDNVAHSVFCGFSDTASMCSAANHQSAMNRFKLAAEQKQQNDDVHSQWAGSDASGASGWETGSVMSSRSIGNFDSKTPLTGKPIHPNVRDVKIYFGQADWNGIHSYQQQLMPFNEAMPPNWCTNAYDCNYIKGKLKCVLWLYTKPCWVPPPTFLYNRSISNKYEWRAAYTRNNIFISESGPDNAKLNYLMFLTNVNKPITIVESAMLKHSGEDFGSLLNQTILHCKDHIVKYFPDLKMRSARWTFENDLKNELIWVHSIKLHVLNRYILENKYKRDRFEGILKFQTFFDRAISAHLLFVDAYIVCNTYYL